MSLKTVMEIKENSMDSNGNQCKPMRKSVVYVLLSLNAVNPNCEAAVSRLFENVTLWLDNFNRVEGNDCT